MVSNVAQPIPSCSCGCEKQRWARIKIGSTLQWSSQQVKWWFLLIKDIIDIQNAVYALDLLRCSCVLQRHCQLYCFQIGQIAQGVLRKKYVSCITSGMYENLIWFWHVLCTWCLVLVEFCELSRNLELYSSLCAENLEELYSCKLTWC